MSDQKFSVLRVFHKIIEPIRDLARENGYCIAWHGSLARDIDLVAVPWTDEAIDASDLVQKIKKLLFDMYDYAEWGAPPQPENKPHGRLAWSIHIGGTYIDISVTPKP